MPDVRPFKVEVPQEALDDLQRRLRHTRWPERETVQDRSQGVPLARAHQLADYWLKGYDWRAREKRLNRFEQFITAINGLDIHFIHQRSSNAAARPLIITHGWPGSVVEFQKIIEPLTEPQKHGGDAADAFHVVCPSLPGFGFSGKPQTTGWGVEKIAQTWDSLMCQLGYEQYFAQGGDWGAIITQSLAAQALGHCRAIHVNMPIALPTAQAHENPDAEDQAMLAAIDHYERQESGYSRQQATYPQSLAYGLVDSPVGQMAWIVDKFRVWTDSDGNPENVLGKDELLDNVMLYWLTATGASSARLYWESFTHVFTEVAPIDLPTGISRFPGEIWQLPRSWADARFSNIIHWNTLDRGGHFAAFEQPELFVNEVRVCFRSMRI